MSNAFLQADLLKSAVTALPTDKLSGVRSAALARFATSGFPTTRHEDWKYTNLSAAEALSSAWLQNQSANDPAIAAVTGTQSTEQIDAHWITIRNGIIDSQSVAALQTLAAAGVEITLLSERVNEGLIDIEAPMSAFNAALLHDGLHIKATSSDALDKPLGILHIDDGSAAVTQVRTVIEVCEQAKLQIIECSTSAGNEAQFSNSVMQVALAEGACLEVVRVQEREKQHLSVNRMTAVLSANASLDYNNFDFGGSLARNDLIADIAGSDASVVMRGLYLAGNEQHIDNHTRVDHRVGPATSNEEYRGILAGRSRCVFNGKAVVHAGADGTDANQSNHNLLLSDSAEIDTKPELEIYADDVKCSHGATVGQLDPTSLFYLRTRGLDEDQATQILTRAFAATIPLQLPIDHCRDYIAAAIDAKLDSLISDGSE
jgi:Fe-S cluster assembly protein SufD